MYSGVQVQPAGSGGVAVGGASKRERDVHKPAAAIQHTCSRERRCRPAGRLTCLSVCLSVCLIVYIIHLILIVTFNLCRPSSLTAYSHLLTSLIRLQHQLTSVTGM